MTVVSGMNAVIRIGTRGSDLCTLAGGLGS